MKNGDAGIFPVYYSLKATLYTIVPRSPFFAFCTPKHCRLQKQSGSMSASMKWRYLNHLQLLSKAVAAMAEMEISPQEEIASPEGMKVFAVERPELSEDFVYFSSLCGVQSSPLVFAPNLPFVLGPLHW